MSVDASQRCVARCSGPADFKELGGTAGSHPRRTSYNLTPSKLPLVISRGKFRHLSLLDDTELESFLSYLIRFTSKQFGIDINQIPRWWTESVFYHADFARGLIPAPETRNKHVKLRRLIKLCYLHYNCKSLLIMSEQLATQHPENYKFMQEPQGNIAVYRVKTMTIMVRIPPSNLDYDVDRKPNLQNGYVPLGEVAIAPTPRYYDVDGKPILQNGHAPDVTITPSRRPIPLFSPSKKSPVGPPEVIVLDSSSESDDEVQIIAYEPGALPPTPPRIRPGPACSKIRPAPRPFVRPASVQQTLAFGAVPRHSFPVYRPPPQQMKYQAYRHPPPQPSVSARSKYLQCRPRRNIKIEHVDLTVDEEEDVVHPTLPTDLSLSDFLARMGLGTSTDPTAIQKKTVPPPPWISKNKRLNLRDIPFTMIPYLVGIGYLPRRALCSPTEVDRRTDFIDKHTGRDTNWFLVTVNTRDLAAMAAATKKCWVPVKRLNSADMRRWRR